MKLTDIFDTSTNTAVSVRLEALAKVVVKAREAYGNTEAVIAAPEVHTTEGLQDIAMTSADDKLAIAASEFRNIKAVAVEYSKSYDGAILDKKIEELIAISPIMANITATVDSEYL